MNGETTQTDDALAHARLLQRVWRGLKDGDCLSCNGDITVFNVSQRNGGGLCCSGCGFTITGAEIAEIKKMYAPARLQAVTVFKAWQQSRRASDQ